MASKGQVTAAMRGLAADTSKATAATVTATAANVASKATSKASKATKATATATDTSKATKAQFAPLLAVEVAPVSKDNITVKASKRLVASILAAVLVLRVTVTKATYEAFVSLTAAYRHGVATATATADGDSNNAIYIRHATAGLLGNPRHQWAVDCLTAASDKDLAAVLAGLKVNMAAVATAAKASKVKSLARLANLTAAAKATAAKAKAKAKQA